MSGANAEAQQFTPVDMEFSDGSVRNPRFRVSGTHIYAVIGCVVAVYSLAVAILLGKVSNGIHRLVESNARAERRIAGLVQVEDEDVEFKIVSWCPCGRTLPAETLPSDADYETVALPIVDATCFGCFDKWSSGVSNTFSKTDYDPAEGPSVRSFTYQMIQHGLTDETIVSKCGWHKEGNAYFAYEQEEIDVRMCVIEEFLNHHMIGQGWTIWSSTWLYQTKDHLAFVRNKPNSEL